MVKMVNKKDETVYISTVTENPSPELNTYRIWYSDGNDRNEIGRVSAKDIDQAVDYTVKQYLKPETEYQEGGDDEHLYLMIDVCKDCEHKETMVPVGTDCSLEDCSDCTYTQCEENLEYESVCDYCERSETIEIELDNTAEKEYKTIYGVNEYADLETGELPSEHDPLLAKAWNMNPQLGADTLMIRTIEQNPKLFSAIDQEYLKRLYETRKEVINDV